MEVAPGEAVGPPAGVALHPSAEIEAVNATARSPIGEAEMRTGSLMESRC